MTVKAARLDPVQERQAAYDALAAGDRALARLVLRYGTPDLHYLRRPDAFPAADVGLLRAAQSVLGLPRRPTQAELSAPADASALAPGSTLAETLDACR
ncbi:MAG: hypothetical protein JO153_22030 [Solirubrobacterales bacterium]|nr:hypothetical protein [Solirubrobacterales bacterium]